MRFQLVRCSLIVIVATLWIVGCATIEQDAQDPTGLYDQAERAYQRENYLSALEKFRQVKNRYPYSSKATQAELRIADTYFAQESYIEAEAGYEIFREMHPAYPEIDYVQFRVGLSFFKQIPDNIARDLTAAHRAIEEFDVLLAKYPSSKYREEAEKWRKQARTKLAEHEAYVANFYFQRKHYLSASYRYASLFKTFPGLGYDEISLYRLGVCYYRIRMFPNSRDALQRLVKDFPNSGFKGDAFALLKNMEAGTTIP